MENPVTSIRFVVWMGAKNGQLGPKVFESKQDASAYASQRVADDADNAEVYEIPLPDMPIEKMTRAAIAALEMGEGIFVEARGSRVSEVEYERARARDWERAQKEGADAILRFLGL
jgi:hypothetical protein